MFSVSMCYRKFLRPAKLISIQKLPAAQCSAQRHMSAEDAKSNFEQTSKRVGKYQAAVKPCKEPVT